MSNRLNFKEAPNILELVEAYRGFTSDLIDLSFCSDEGQDVTISVYADEGPFDHSICADEFESDVRLKTDIEQVGTTVYGLPLYQFGYKTGAERFEGVMAQDVLR
jgi:Chaperone of endosialidase